MGVALEELYAEIIPQNNIILHTEGCYGKNIDWVHMVEEVEFISLLHGDELVFNSGLNYSSEEWILRFIKELNEVHASGLIIALTDGRTFSKEVITYCNSIQFPLFSAGWKSPYIDIMRMFAEMLLRNKQIGSDLASALKNAIYYPKNEEAYLDHFERNGFISDMSFIVAVLSCHTYETKEGNKKLEQIQKSFADISDKVIIYEENGQLTILFAEEKKEELRKNFEYLCKSDHNVYAGIGTVVSDVRLIYKSYQNACSAYQLTKTAIPNNLLSYEELGVYKLLAGIKETELLQVFVSDVLGRLIAYDLKKETDYLEILKVYFENECSIKNTAKMLYCHKNTLTYKLNKIKKILGYDILCNEKRMSIMVAFSIFKMREK